MARKTKKTEESAAQLAEKLYEVRKRMADDDLLNKALTKSLRDAMAREGTTEAGQYHIVRSTSYKVADESVAMPFALERVLIKVDTSKIREVFRLDSALRFKNPEQYGFEVTSTDRVMPKGTQEE